MGFSAGSEGPFEGRMRNVARQAVALGRQLFMDGQQHTKMRVLVSKAFTRGRVAALEERIRQFCVELLDAPDTNSPCEQRGTSTTAPQALTFLNGDFANEQAAHLADRLVRESPDDASRQVRLAYRLALCRPPSADEEKRILAFVDRQSRQIEADSKIPAGAARRRALASFCLVLLNTSEFFYPG